MNKTTLLHLKYYLMKWQEDKWIYKQPHWNMLKQKFLLTQNEYSQMKNRIFVPPWPSLQDSGKVSYSSESCGNMPKDILVFNYTLQSLFSFSFFLSFCCYLGRFHAHFNHLFPHNFECFVTIFVV